MRAWKILNPTWISDSGDSRITLIKRFHAIAGLQARSKSRRSSESDGSDEENRITTNDDGSYLERERWSWAVKVS